MTRVPLIGPRGRVKILGDNSAWVTQKMKAATTFTGDAPATDTVVAADLDPTISAGRAEYTELAEGGLFDILAKAGKSYVIEAVDNIGNAALTIEHPASGESRDFPTDTNGDIVFPVHCGPGECPKGLNGTAATTLGFLVREVR